MQNQFLEVTGTSDFQRKKQAVHFALCTILTKDEAARAVNSWVQHVSAAPSLFSGLNLFARKVCEAYGKDSRQSELALAISRALMSGDIGAAPNDADHGFTQAKYENNSESAAELSGSEIMTPEFVCFQSLLQVLLHKVAERDAALGGSCREFLLHVVDNLPWSPEQQAQVNKLVKTGSTTQSRPYRAGQLKALVHHLVMWMNDMLGEATSGELSRYAIDAVERSTAGKVYSPSEFFPDSTRFR